MADPYLLNDTLVTTLAQLENEPVILSAAGEMATFESTPDLTLVSAQIGLNGAERWDYSSSSINGQLRTNAGGSIVVNGSRSISLDARFYTNPSSPANWLTGTYNLAGISAAAQQVRLSFDFRLTSIPASMDSNQVFVRGSDTSAWLAAYVYDTTAPSGTVVNSGTIPISEILAAQGQDFSTSTQVRFGQRDVTLIGSPNFGTGITLDNVRLFKVDHDLQLLQALAPPLFNCDLPSGTSVSLKVYNSVSAVETNVPITYRLDGGTPVTEIVPVIPAYDSVTYTFSTALPALTFGVHTLAFYLESPLDDHQENDSLLQYQFRNQPTISQFPYLQTFEDSSGYFFSGGINSSWMRGMPGTTLADAAANGQKVWKTKLSGFYNNNEDSYLYTPCFDVTALTSPMLSFKPAV